MRMIKIYTLLLGLFCLGSAQAQQDDLAVFTTQSTLHSARFNPATYGSDGSTFQFSIPYLHVNGGTNILTRSQGTEILNGGKIPTSLIEDILLEMPSTLQVYNATNISPLSLGGSIRIANKELLSVFASVTEQVGAKVSLQKEIPAFLWYGNKRFAGINLPLGPIVGEAMWQREIAFGAAAPIPIPLTGIKLRAGFKAKYLVGIAALHTDYSRFDILTAGNGSSIDVDVESTYQFAGIDDFNPLKGAGKGFGVDLGISAEIMGPYTLDISVIDLGSKIKWTENTTQFDINGTESFDGVDIENLFSNDSIIVEEFDSLEAYIDIIETNGREFETAANTRIFVKAGYTFIEGYSKKTGSYPMHAIYGTWMQGLHERSLSSAKPQLSLAYVFNLHNILQAGAKVGYAWNSFQFGAFAGVKAGGFSFGLSSGDLGGLLIGSSNYGADLSTNLTFSF